MLLILALLILSVIGFIGFFSHSLGNQGLDYIYLMNKKTNYVKDIIIIIMGASSNLD